MVVTGWGLFLMSEVLLYWRETTREGNILARVSREDQINQLIFEIRPARPLEARKASMRLSTLPVVNMLYNDLYHTIAYLDSLVNLTCSKDPLQ